MREVIERSKDGYACPFIAHDPTERFPPTDERAERHGHQMQVFPEELSQAFREVSGFYKKIEHPPSLYGHWT